MQRKIIIITSVTRNLEEAVHLAFTIKVVNGEIANVVIYVT